MMTMVSFRIDDVTLRDEPVDHDAARDHAHTLAPSGEKVVWLRMLGELDAAEVLGWELLAHAGGPATPDAVDAARLPIEAVAPALRLAHVLQWQGRFRDADRLFDAAMATAVTAAETAPAGSPAQRRARTLVAFASQHLGKSRFDEDRLDEALVLFERALAIRVEIGAPDDQVQSSQQAIRATRGRAAHPSA